MTNTFSVFHGFATGGCLSLSDWLSLTGDEVAIGSPMSLLMLSF
jgi:hypothetical protein